MKFLHPYFLFGLFLTAVPVIIHLLFRKSLKKIPFSSLIFLKSAEASRMRWLRLKEILLLILRCLTVASIFLALSRPQLESRLFFKNRLAAVYLIIDNSFSMGYGKNFENALNQAEKIISSYSNRSMFFVAPLCAQKDFKPLWCYKKKALELLKYIKLSFSTGSLKDIYTNFLQEETDLPKEFIYIGDGQMTTFKDIDEFRDFYWINISAGSNVAIENVSLKEPFIIPGDYYDIKVNIKNYSLRTFKGTAELNAENLSRKQDCEIPPGQGLIILFSIPSYIHNGVIKIDDDSLPGDNKYYFSKTLLTKLRLLIVGDEKYLKLALSPSSIIKTPFVIDNTFDIKKADLRPYQIIILNGIKEINEFEVLKLRNFLNQQRSGIIVFLGTEISEELKNFLTECGLIKEHLNLDGYVNIDWIDNEYQPLSIFKKNPGLKMIKFFKLWRIEPRGRVLASLTNTLPLVINQNNLVIFAAELKEDNTDIIYNPNFLPLLHSIIYGLINNNIDNEYRVGEKLPVAKLIKDPEGKNLLDYIFLRPGFHTIDDKTVGVNIDPLESNLNSINSEMAKNLGIKIIKPESLLGPADLTMLFLILGLCTFAIELLLLIL